jgi:hypothetical protein
MSTRRNIRKVNGDLRGTVHVGNRYPHEVHVTTGWVDNRKVYFMEKRDLLGLALEESTTYTNAAILRKDLREIVR